MKNPNITSDEYESAMRQFFAVKPRNLNDGKPYPKRGELYDERLSRWRRESTASERTSEDPSD